MDCNICMEDMKTESFKHPEPNQEKDKVDEKNSLCLRLKCGHAYHTECMVMAFREKQGCPMCRESLQTNTIDDVLINNNGIVEIFDQDNNLLMNLNIDDFQQDFNNENEILNEVETKLGILRTTNYEVMQARHDQNLILRQYNEICEEIKQLKSKAMKETMTKFRLQYRKKFNETLKIVRLQMENTRNIEMELLKEKVTEERLNIFNQSFSDYFYKPEFLPRSVNSTSDPIHLRFWFH